MALPHKFTLREVIRSRYKNLTIYSGDVVEVIIMMVTATEFEVLFQYLLFAGSSAECFALSCFIITILWVDIIIFNIQMREMKLPYNNTARKGGS